MPTEPKTVDVLLPGGRTLKVPEDAVPEIQHLSNIAAKPLTVHQAIARVMVAMAPVGKDDQGPVSQGSYQYRGIEAVTAALQKLCGEHGVVIWPQARVVDAPASLGMKEEKGYLDWRVEVTWGVAGPDGSMLDPAPITVGIGRDNVDKGVNKAMTQAYKYLLLELFMVSDGGAGQHDTDGIDYEADRATAPRGKAMLGETKAREIAGTIATLTAEQRAWLADAWTAEDPMTGDRYLPTDENGKPALRFVTDDLEVAVRNLVAQAARQRVAPDTGEAPDSPQDGPDEDPAPGTADEPSAATEAADARDGDEPY